MVDIAGDANKKARISHAIEKIIHEYKECYPDVLDFNGDLYEFCGKKQLDEILT